MTNRGRFNTRLNPCESENKCVYLTIQNLIFFYTFTKTPKDGGWKINQVAKT